MFNLKDFICGLGAGWTQIMIGQPLDYIKIKIQLHPNDHFDVKAFAKEIYQQHGFLGFYRGSSTQFLGQAFTTGFQFFILQSAKRFINSIFHPNSQSFETGKMKLWEVYLAGSIVGVVCSLIYCPAQYAKIQLQMKGQIKQSAVGFLFRDMFKNGFKNVYKGFKTTLFREMLSSGLYYGAYQSTLRYLTKHERQKALSHHYLISGAAAGVSYQIIAYPIDIVKSNIQMNNSIKDSIAAAMKLSKLRGYKIVLARGALMDSFSFVVYQNCQKIFNKIQNPYYSMY